MERNWRHFNKVIGERELTRFAKPERPLITAFPLCGIKNRRTVVGGKIEYHEHNLGREGETRIGEVGKNQSNNLVIERAPGKRMNGRG